MSVCSDAAQTLTRDYEECLRCFNRVDYPVRFARYLEEHRPYFTALSPEDAADAAQALVNHAESLIRFPRRRALVLLDMQRFFLLYLIPAALESGAPGAAVLAERLRGDWNALHPDHAFGECTYQQLLEGFRAKRPFGL